MITRRRLGLLAGSSALALTADLLARPALAQAKPKVVVIGGGAGGATAAKYIAKDSKGAIDVTLVEPQSAFTTCFHSNLFLGGVKTFEQITHTYDKLTSAYGITHARDSAQAIDLAKREVKLAGGKTLPYDRLVISPGIDLDYASVPGWAKEHEEVMPHAWKAGPQTKILKAKLDSVPDGGVVVVIAPPNPFRCPPGPYERVSMMAHVLTTAGKKKSKIIILDAKDKFSKQALFQEGWEKHYPGMVEWLAPSIHDGIKSVDPKTGTVTTGFETYKDCALVNVIPKQMAGAIVREAGLAAANGFCDINAETMKSVKDANVYVIGDAINPGDMPKSAFSANSQAKAAAMLLRGELVGAKTFPVRLANTCWSMIDTDDTVKVGGRYEAKDGKITAIENFISQTGETAALRKQTQEENIGWYAGITADMFG